MRDLISAGGPAILASLFQFLVESSEAIAIGHLGDTEAVASAGLAFTLLNIFVYGIFMGLNGAIDTLVSQAKGADLDETANWVLNRARVINTLLFVPCALALWFAEEIFTLLGQDPVVSRLAAEFLRFQVPGMLFLIHFNTSVRYLQASGEFGICTWVSITSVLIEIALLLILFMCTNLASLNWVAGIASLSFLINLILVQALWAYKNWRDKVEMLSWRDGAFDEWREYLSFGVPSAVMCCAEFWIFEVITLMAGYLSTTELATIVVVTNFYSVIYEVASGFSFAITSLVGQNLGEENERGAQIVAIAGMIVQTGINLLILTLLLLIPHWICGVYTNIPEINAQFTESLVGISLMVLLDTYQAAVTGIVKGAGIQFWASIVNFVAYFIFCVPMMWLIAFQFDLRVNGLLLGYICGVAISLCFNIYLLVTRDWVAPSSIADDDLSYVSLDLEFEGSDCMLTASSHKA